MKKKQTKRKTLVNQVLSMILSVAMAVTLFAGVDFGWTTEVKAASVELRNPWKDADGNTVWDCVWFGNYWQNDTNNDGKADQKDDKEPIKWRVLSVDENDNTAFLLADKGLDSQPYNTEYKDVTWETCTLRGWLNGSFLGAAFSEEEQAAVLVTDVVNGDNPYYGTAGGNDTSDKVYLLSIAEVSDAAYGFNGTFYVSDKARGTKATAYAKAQGAWTSNEVSDVGKCWWWLRSPGDNSGDVSYVLFDGGLR